MKKIKTINSTGKNVTWLHQYFVEFGKTGHIPEELEDLFELTRFEHGEFLIVKIDFK